MCIYIYISIILLIIIIKIKIIIILIIIIIYVYKDVCLGGSHTEPRIATRTIPFSPLTCPKIELPKQQRFLIHVLSLNPKPETLNPKPRTSETCRQGIEARLLQDPAIETYVWSLGFRV